jgi:7-carboxy-7-deazaguanine synthase
MTELVVNEIFHSIQGESSHSGRPCIFIRLTYCNLRCVWCDTAYAFTEGRKLAVKAIVREIAGMHCTLVEVTGGEPLHQPGVHELLSTLCDAGYETLLETGGSLDISGVDSRVRRIVDIKCPGSGMAARNLWSNIQHLRPTDEVKFVLTDRADFDWACGVIAEHGLAGRCPFLFSPVFGVLDPTLLARWVLESGLPGRLQLQLHKLLWDPLTRGV